MVAKPSKTEPEETEGPTPFSGMGIPFLWPYYFFMGEQTVDAIKQNIKVLDELQKTRHRSLKWTTENRVTLDLRTHLLREFKPARTGRTRTLIVPPYSGNSSVIVDLNEERSVVKVLSSNGVKGLCSVDWKSATPDMKDLDIDNYLADLNVTVDDLGGHVNLVGFSQGGWLSAMFASRFPEKVKSLVLCGAPIDTHAGSGTIRTYASRFPMSYFETLVASGGGVLEGEYMLGAMRTARPGEHYMDKYLQLYEHIEDKKFLKDFEILEKWFTHTIDLPGRWYLQAVKEIFRENRFYRGLFVGLGKRLALDDIACPTYLLAGEWDDVTPKEQVLHAADRIGTRKSDIVQEVAPSGHLGLLTSQAVLNTYWPRIARWLRRSSG